MEKILKKYTAIVFVILISFFTHTIVKADSFSLDGIEQKNIDIKNIDKNNPTVEYIKKKFTFEFGALPSYNLFNGSKTSAAAIVAFSETWEIISIGAKAGYYYSKYKIILVPDCPSAPNRYCDPEVSALPDKTYYITYNNLELQEIFININPSKYVGASFGRQYLNWGQVDSFPAIGLLILPLNDNIITLSPSKNDFFYPQDLLSISLFPVEDQEFKIIYFIDHRLAPVFMDLYGHEILQKGDNNIPKSWALRHIVYGSKNVFAITYFSGISYLGGINNNSKVIKLPDGSYNIINDAYYDINNDLPSSVTNSNTYAKSYALGLESSYSFNPRLILQGEIAIDFTEKTFYPKKNENNIYYLEYIANNGIYYHSNTLLGSLAIVYSGARIDSSVGFITFYSSSNLLKSDRKQINHIINYEGTKAGKDSLIILPTFTISYALDKLSSTKISLFVGNKGPLFGIGSMYAQDINQYITYGASLGYYIGLSDILGVSQLYGKNPIGYRSSFNEKNIIQGSLFLRLKI
jgi:hypothetical protein